MGVGARGRLVEVYSKPPAIFNITNTTLKKNSQVLNFKGSNSNK